VRSCTCGIPKRQDRPSQTLKSPWNNQAPPPIKGADRTAAQEYFAGLKQSTLALLRNCIGPFAMTVTIGVVVLAIVGIIDHFSVEKLFSAQWQRVASWVAIVFCVGVHVLSHVKSLRQKGRTFLDHKR
jgi:hypothetical protein